MTVFSTLTVFAAVFAITVLILLRLIPYLKSKKLGQSIFEIGPRWHKNKEGTPTMGGLSFLIAVTVALIASVAALWKTAGGADTFMPMIVTYAMALVNAMIGITDDLTKFRRHQNGGLTAWQKYLLQLLASGGYLFAMKSFGMIDTVLKIPFTDIAIELGGAYYVFAILLITGIINSVNLTDGLDGLASSVTFVVGGFFAVLACASSFIGLGLLGGAVCGACLGFLVFNFYPARVFMGDTGSLFLGALVVGMAFLTSEPLIIVLAGAIYVFEALSDILQVVWCIAYKKIHRIRGPVPVEKRLFKMAPFHHHLEKCGWSEVGIVLTFSAVTVVFCVLAWFGI